MKTITINHPLRTINYRIHKDSFPMPHESLALNDYRSAHDQVWRMKLLFEKEKGEAQLALINLHKLDEERAELNDMLDFYKEEVDFSSESLLTDLDINFQVELRNFYNDVVQHHHKLVRFYDVIAACDTPYRQITDTYFRGKKTIDPLDFTVLDSVFRHHSDMQVDVVSLDKDLQQFLAALTGVYELLDAYIQQYNVLYSTYTGVLQKTAQLTKDVQVLEAVWED